MKPRTFSPSFCRPAIALSVLPLMAFFGSSTPNQDDHLPTLAVTVATLPQEAIFEDEPMLTIARVVASFAGYYYSDDGEELIVALTRSGDLDLAVPLIVPTLKALPVRGFTARQVEYALLELARYRTVLREYLFRWPGVVALGVDESDNGVMIGVEAASSIPALRELLAAVQIPQAAVLFEIRPPVRDLADLVDGPFPDSIIGAYQIRNKPGGFCTLGFAARTADTGADVFFTNSHCTDTPFSFDGEPFTYGATKADTLGFELLDPSPVNSTRNADVAMIDTDGELPSGFGFLARTTWSSGDEHDYGSLIVDSILPRFRIVSRGNHVIENEILEKIGRTSGWTYGAVESTCDDILTSGVWKLCSDRVDFVVDDGDSGSPVFDLAIGGTAELRGIVFGKVDGLLNDGYMSDLHQIELDMGEIVVHDLTAVIQSGPDLVPPNAWCEWVGVRKEGISPFTYEWRKNGVVVSTSEVYQTSNTGTSDFQLSFRVIDALADTATAFLSVTIDHQSSEMVCDT